MDASGPGREIAYRRIHGLEAQPRMPGSGRSGEHPSCCAWLVRLCRCFSGDSDDSQEATPRSRALESHLYQYEAPAVHPSTGAIAHQQRTAIAYEDDADAGPLLPKTAQSSAPLPRPGHSRNNSSASAAAAAAAAAATGSVSSVGGGGEAPSLGGSGKRPGGGGSHDSGPGAGPGSAAPGDGGPRAGGHHRSGSYGEAAAGRARWSKGDGANVPAVETPWGAAAAVAAEGAGAAAAAGHAAPSTVAGRPGTAFGPMQDEDDDFCPTCLDPYTEENPKIFTECGHHFHMPCIYAWLERKDTCPMCESPMQAPGM